MTSRAAAPQGVDRRRLFFGICLALIPTGASFALVSNILIPLKEEFILTNYQVGLIGGAALWGMAISLMVLGPLLEAYGLRNGARLAFGAHLAGITIMISAAGLVGDPSAFWVLMLGAATLAVGNGMIEVAGNPLVAALYPEEKTTRLNWFHAFFPLGIIAGGLVGFALVNWGGGLGHWTVQLGVIYLPVLAYGWFVLAQPFPRTENTEAGLPVGEMFRYTLTHPLFLLILLLMGIAISLELGPMRWVPAVLEAVGMHGILVLVWISGWMVVLRLLAGHFVERLSPTGMLLGAGVLLLVGLTLLSYVESFWGALVAATIFAWGVAFNFPTIVGLVSERLPRTGSLGIVLTAGVGLGAAGGIGVPIMGHIADRHLPEALDGPATVALLNEVEARFPIHLERAAAAEDVAELGYRSRDVSEALIQTEAALQEYEATGVLAGDVTANALRAIMNSRLPDEPLVARAGSLLLPAEAHGGQISFRYVAPAALILILVFGTMYMVDLRRGGYRAVRLERGFVIAPFLVALAMAGSPGSGSAQAAPAERLQVLFLGDDGHHRPFERAKEILPVLAASGIDMFYTDDADDLDPERLARFHALILYNNQPAVTRPQLSALLGFVEGGGGLVALHSAAAAFQNSEEFIRLVGGAFKSHGTGTFGVTRVEPGHPAIQDVPSFESWDETYVHTKHNPVDRTVLEVRREGDHGEPWTWVRTYGDGRVFYTAWGHDGRTWGNEGFQALLVRGLRWSAGDWALEAPRATEPDLPVAPLPVPLPVYERPPAPWNTLADQHILEAQVALGPEESLRFATLHPGFHIELFAAEPMIGRIIDFAWDERGRMWAVETNDYPNRVLPDTVPGGDRILILEDTDGDGRADEAHVFADGLNLATSLVLVDGGVIVAQAPHIFFLKDTTGDGRADVKETIMTGWPRGDTHGTPSNFRYGLDNQVLGSVGYNGFDGEVGGRVWGRGDLASGYFRFTGDGSSLDYLARTSNNTWGVAQSEDGFIFGSTANSRPSNFVHIPGRYYRTIGVSEASVVLPGIQDRNDIYPLLPEIRQVDQFGRYTSGAAHEIYTARAFPAEYWNRMAFVTDPTGHLVGMFELQPRGSSYMARNRWNFMASRDTWVAPVQVKVGPDGAIWVSDFYTLVAQHNPTPQNIAEDCCDRGPGNAYETPNRDAQRARIYRIGWEGAPPREPMDLGGATPDELVATLRHDNMFWRLTAQRILVERGEWDVAGRLVDLLRDHTVDEMGLNPGALHALWTLHGLGTIPDHPAAESAVRDALNHPAPSLRRAALQVLPRDERLLDDIFAAGMLPDRSSPHDVDYTVGAAVLQDADARVRLQALLTLSELPASERAARAVLDLILVPGNARDPWLPDAAAIAGAAQGPELALELMRRRPLASDSTYLTGLRNTLHLLTRHRASEQDKASILALLAAVPDVHPIVGEAVLVGLAGAPPGRGWRAELRGPLGGWPEESPPELTDEERAALADWARAADPGLREAVARLGEVWGLPELASDGGDPEGRAPHTGGESQ